MTKGIDKYSIDSTDYTVGQDNVQKWGFDVHNPVFGISAGLILLFLLATLVVDADTAKSALDGIKWKIIGSFDWLFIWSGNIFVIFCLALVVSPYGKIRLGGQEAVADHSFISWLSMLFAAGMGIGLMFWSVAEPVAYFTGWYETPLGVEANSPEAAKLALGQPCSTGAFTLGQFMVLWHCRWRFSVTTRGFRCRFDRFSIRFWAIAPGAGRGTLWIFWPYWPHCSAWQRHWV